MVGRAWDLLVIACFTLAALGAVAVLAITPLALGPAIGAAHGQGTPGVFTAQSEQCSRRCTWYGTFRSEPGTVLQNADYGDSAPAGTHAGSAFPALWPGGSNDVFAAHGSTSWIGLVFLDVFAVVVLAAIVWNGPIRYLRKRTRHVPGV
jgi:hypothetical protein